MNLRQLHYFIKIVDAQSMTKAAEQLHVAQPALSQQIRQLEASLGVSLLHRTARGISPSQEGELLYRHARTILRHVDNTRAMLSQKSTPLSGTVSIAMASSTARMLSLPLIRASLAQYPSIILEIVDLPSADLMPALQTGRVDFAMAPDIQKSGGMHARPIYQEELFLLAMPGAWPLESPVSLQTIATLPLMLPSLPNTLRSRIESALYQAGLSAQLLAEASTSAILVPAARSGLAATILPFSAAHEDIDAGRLAMYSLTPSFHRTMYLCRDLTQVTSDVGNVIHDLLLDVAASTIAAGGWKGCTHLDAGQADASPAP